MTPTTQPVSKGSCVKITRDACLRCFNYSNAIKIIEGFPGGSVVKNLLAMWETQETWARSLGREDPLEEEVATHSSILARKILWTEEPGGLQSMGSQRVRHD